ncbi:MAG: helix-turn-helix transcriptional regulator [Thermodesulfobacteriota bacterium]
MTRDQLKLCRLKIEKTQEQLSQLLGISPQAVQSYEQGRRRIPVHIERQVLFLLSRKVTSALDRKNCWELKTCPEDRKKSCPAWEFSAGRLCWFICGTSCEGQAQENWEEKMKICWDCEVLTSMTDIRGQRLQ